MQITVQLFATLRQQAGWSEKQIEIPDNTNLGRLLELLNQPEYGLEVAGRPVYAAVNREYADTNTVLQDGDDVALFPPVSGGRANTHSMNK